MPELPEVETIRRDLEESLLGRKIEEVQVLDARLVAPSRQTVFIHELLGRALERFDRRGKYLILGLSGGGRLMFHLRMTGQLIVSKKHTGPSRLLVRFDDGTQLAFCDQRRFGEVWSLKPGDPWPSRVPLGPDALTELDKEQFVSIIKSRTTRIQPLLMDQSLMAGVGNIYAQEALFKAAVRPTRPGQNVTKKEAERLYRVLREILQKAITHRGSTSRNYRDAYGESGSAQTLHSVYRKGGLPCRRCSTRLRSARVGGRGSVFCPRCQK